MKRLVATFICVLLSISISSQAFGQFQLIRLGQANGGGQVSSLTYQLRESAIGVTVEGKLITSLNYQIGGYVCKSLPWPIDREKSKVEIEPKKVIANGTESAKAMVTLIDLAGDAIPNREVVITMSGEGNLLDPPKVTNTAGQATFFIKSTKAEQKTVNVIIDGLSLLSQPIEFTPSQQPVLTLLLSKRNVKLAEKLTVQGQIILPSNWPKPQEKVQISLSYLSLKGELIERVAQADEKLIYQDEIEVNSLGSWKVTAKWDKNAQQSDTFEVTKGDSQLQLQLLSLEAVKVGEIRKIIGSLKSLIKGEPLKSEPVRVDVIKPSGTKEAPRNLTTNEFGKFEFDVKFDSDGSWQIEAIWDGNGSYLSSKSEALSIPVGKENPKAIVVLGGGSESVLSPTTWSQFAILANYVYITFSRRRGLTHDDIYYLSPTEKPLDAVDSKTSKEALKFAITDWAKKRTSKNVPLFIYLISHNIDDRFLLEKSADREVVLTPEDLAEWLDVLDKDVEVTLIIEACFSGNFIVKKRPSGEPILSKSKRTIITSASESKQAFILRDLSSFSKVFFDQILRNESVSTAFLRGRNAVKALRSLQSPQIDANGDGKPNDPTRDFPAVEKRYIPDFRAPLPSVPEIKEVTAKPSELKAGEKSATIEAKVFGTDIKSVYAHVIPPNFDPNKTFQDWNELAFDQIKLQKVFEVLYKGEYDNFTIPGEYAIVVYAENPDGSAIPTETKVLVTCPAWDVNRDGVVDIFDMVIVAKNFSAQPFEFDADVNADGKVDIFDLVLVATHFGEKCPLDLSVAKAAPIRDLAHQQKQIISDALADVSLLTQLRDLMKSIPNPNPGILKAIAELERLIAVAKNIPSETKLLANYPNPFNPETWIPYQLSKPAEVEFRIYDISGRLVRHLRLGYKEAGTYMTRERAAYWDGRNKTGERVASGMYFYQLRAGSFFAIRRMLVLK